MGQPVGPIFLDCVTLEDGTNRLPQNYQPALMSAGLICVKLEHRDIWLAVVF